ncbi:MAG: DUF692 family protein [Rhizobiales bacterium]|nr:DUF692 family protein [Hyphomicrobiales bacterium]
MQKPVSPQSDLTGAASLPDRDGFHPIPARAGIGLKPAHYAAILETQPDIGWFEVHAENYMGAGGAPHRYLETITARYPLSLHGVGLSLGSAGPLDRAHAKRLRALVDRYRPALVSEHLAWTRFGATHFNDLLPLPLTDETLALVRAHVDETQQILGRQMLIENPSTYVRFDGPQMSEPDFLVALAEATGCGLLIDVNNVQVSSVNHMRDARAWLDAIPGALVHEVHLAGHAIEMIGGERLLIDNHGGRVSDAVMALYRRFVERVGSQPTLIEWDMDVPSLDVLLEEAVRAERVLDAVRDLGPVMAVRHG